MGRQIQEVEKLVKAFALEKFAEDSFFKGVLSSNMKLRK
jgi:hypothetical protein